LRQDRLKNAFRSVEAGLEIGLGFLFDLLHFFFRIHIFPFSLRSLRRERKVSAISDQL
jgi:hypothetical protein